jgi:anti-sigma28 factor (negative regulator of flagellin synthesis)
MSIMHDAHPQDPTHDHDTRMARKIAQEAPEVRKDRIAAAKRALQQGTLMLDADTLADRILADPLQQDDEVI